MNVTRQYFPCVLENALLHIRELSGLPFAAKKDWATLLHLYYYCYLLRIILLQNYLLPLLSVLVENTLLKIVYRFLLLLVGFITCVPAQRPTGHVAGSGWGGLLTGPVCVSCRGSGANPEAATPGGCYA